MNTQTDQTVRLECLRQAVLVTTTGLRNTGGPHTAVDPTLLAQQMYTWVIPPNVSTR